MVGAAARCCRSTLKRAASSTTTRSTQAGRRASLRRMARSDAVQTARITGAGRGTRGGVCAGDGAERPNDPTTQLKQQQAGPPVLPRADGTRRDDPVGSMGTDTPIAALSNNPKLLYNYFKQNFAQVTPPAHRPNPRTIGHVARLDDRVRPNLLGHEAGTHYRLEVSQPILTNGDLKKIHAIGSALSARIRSTPPGRRSRVRQVWRGCSSGCVMN